MNHEDLHQAGADGRCTACGQPFPCPTAAARFASVPVDIEHAHLAQPAPTERELHQLAEHAAALKEIAVLYRAVYAQRASSAPGPEPTAP